MAKFSPIDKHLNTTYAYVGAFIDELQRIGCTNIVICPGSRSTPLALVSAQHPGLRVWMHVDERSAAFFALGMAKRLRQPVALLCTSGTAAANFFPAIVEAKLTHIPLLVLTADRPHELRENGAPQAIDQNRLYGTHVKWFVEVALPEGTNSALRYIRTLADRTAALAQAVPAGPVHLNFPLREPLTPAALPEQSLPPEEQRDPTAWYGRPNNIPYIGVDDAPLASTASVTLKRVAEQLSSTTRGLIVVGAQDDAEISGPLLSLAQQLGYPILADPLSQLRTGQDDQSAIVTAYDGFLRSETFSSCMQPEVVLRFGAMPTSKPLLLYLKRYASCPQIVIDGNGEWQEPTQLASQMIHAQPAAFCRDLHTILVGGRDSAKSGSPSAWLSTWLESDRITRETLQATLQDFSPLFEGRVFRELAELLPENTTLFAGNSMPIRDLDTFFWKTQKKMRLLGNRGANGIDGIVSTALGISAASQRDEHTVLVIGDLSFYHDLNGLLAAKLHRLNLTVILVNNDGGGIFSFLPQAAYPEHFESVFGTPIDLDFVPIVQAYGGHFQRLPDWQTFREAVGHSITSGGLSVLEVRTERESNVTLHRHLWQAIENALQQRL